MTRRRWIADRWTEDTATLLDAQAAHLGRVLRAQPGQQFDIVAGDRVRRGVIVSVEPNAIQFSLHESLEALTALPLIVALGIIRFERMEWAIEKLTELGVAQIVPLIAQRTEKHLAQAAAKRVERWRRIAHEAAQQSRRSDIPEILDPLPLRQFSPSEPGALRLALSEQERACSLRAWVERLQAEDSRRIYAAIGPEGGWAGPELQWMEENGWESVSLGPRILRAETAAVAVASVWNAWLTATSMQTGGAADSTSAAS